VGVTLGAALGVTLGAAFGVTLGAALGVTLVANVGLLGCCWDFEGVLTTFLTTGEDEARFFAIHIKLSIKLINLSEITILFHM